MNFMNRFDEDNPVPLDAVKDMNRVKDYVSQGIMSAEEGSRLIDNTHRFYREQQKQSGINGMLLTDGRHYTEGSLPEGTRPGTRPANENSGLYQMMDRGMTVGRRDGITPREREQQDLEAHKQYLLKEQRRSELQKMVGPHSEVQSTQLGSAMTWEAMRSGLLNIVPDVVGLVNPTWIPYIKPKEAKPALHPNELKELHPNYYKLGEIIPDLQPIIPSPIWSAIREPEGKTPQERIINRGINAGLSFLEDKLHKKVVEPTGTKIWNKIKTLPKE